LLCSVYYYEAGQAYYREYAASTDCTGPFQTVDIVSTSAVEAGECDYDEDSHEYVIVNYTDTEGGVPLTDILEDGIVTWYAHR
jgi:hypothetical protein